MRIGIDGQALKGKRTGIGRYVFELCKELDKIMPDAQFFVYSKEPVDMPVKSERWIARVDSLLYSRYIWMWIKFRGGYFCQKDKLDAFWGSSSFLPLLSSKTHTVVTVYDLNYILVPDTMSWRNLIGFKLFFKRDVLSSDVVLTISQGTAQRLWELTGVKAREVVYPTISDTFSVQSPEKIKECLIKYNIDFPYFLAVATWEPRKNLELLVETFLDMRKDGLLENYKLLLVGNKGWKDSKLCSLLDKQDSIFPVGYVCDEDLPCLYSGAKAFIFPSVYEGFGIPVLEAKACGTQVIATDIPEIREAGGEGPIYIKPTKEGIRQGILKCMQEPLYNYQMTDYRCWSDGAKVLSQALQANFN